MDRAKKPNQIHSAYTVVYNSESHWSVLTQMWGSKWPTVLPYCLFNVFVMVLLIIVDRHNPKWRYTIEVSSEGHSFITLVVSFLLVSRVSTGLNRYNQARDCLGAMYRESRELIQNTCVFSSHLTGRRASEWRNEVAYRCLLLLRTSMAVIDYPTTQQPAWDVPELTGFEREDVTKSIFTTKDNRRWAHKERSEWEETMRVPIRVAYLLRKSIHSQGQIFGDKGVQLTQENKLLSSVDQFLGGYYGIRKFLTTPVPFPLVQMARTFLFLYVFTVPFVMLSDQSSDIAHCFSVFLMTYGFMGLELVAIELDNPFGDDENDFDNNALACVAYEDTYMTILDVDGPQWADKLRLQMYDGTEDDLCNEQSWLLQNKMV